MTNDVKDANEAAWQSYASKLRRKRRGDFIPDASREDFDNGWDAGVGWGVAYGAEASHTQYEIGGVQARVYREWLVDPAATLAKVSDPAQRRHVNATLMALDAAMTDRSAEAIMHRLMDAAEIKLPGEEEDEAGRSEAVWFVDRLMAVVTSASAALYHLTHEGDDDDDGD